MIKFTKIKNVKSLQRGTPYSAGIDFFIPEIEDFYVKLQKLDEGTGKLELSDPIQVGGSYLLRPGESVLIPSGIKAFFDQCYALIAFNKSGIAAKNSVIIGAELVDPDYRGEIHIDLKNVGQHDIILQPGDKITQFVLVRIGLDDIMEVESEDELWGTTKSNRGTGGFGSTGTK